MRNFEKMQIFEDFLFGLKFAHSSIEKEDFFQGECANF